MSTRKIRVAVLYGGPSSEHEISLLSAASVIRNLDRDRFEVIPIGIDRDGRWLMNDIGLIDQEIRRKSGSSAPILKDAGEVRLEQNRASSHGVIPFDGKDSRTDIDVVFPVLHGPLLEDGSIQGLFELSNTPYVGSGVLGSSVCMDKDVAKRLAMSHGIEVVPWVSIEKREAGRLDQVVEKAIKLGFPLFVKPANMGSSVGVHKCKTENDLRIAITDAFRYDHKVLIEKGIDAREIELAALEEVEPAEFPKMSQPGEIIPSHEFYSYEAKYTDEKGADLIIPAKLTDEQTKFAQEMGAKTFRALNCSGMARVDLFLEKSSGKFYLNEVNTIPGFTTISMYPKMWEASGVAYSDLLAHLIELAMKRHHEKNELHREK